MSYGFLADAIVAVHAAFVGFVVFGQLLIVVGALCRWAWVRNFWFRTAHLLAIGYVAFEAAAGIACPLTTWEHQLRERAGQAVADVTFVGWLLDRLLFIHGAEAVLPYVHMVFGALVLLTFLLVPPRLPRLRLSAARQSAVSR
jgi:Protein of Unknown function (DUF2784)